MQIIAIICFAIGFIIAVVFGIQLLILAFKTSILWGLGSIFIPFVSLVFVIMHWQQAKTPFLRMLLCIPFYIVGGLLMPAGTIPMPVES